MEKEIRTSKHAKRQRKKSLDIPRSKAVLSPEVTRNDVEGFAFFHVEAITLCFLAIPIIDDRRTSHVACSIAIAIAASWSLTTQRRPSVTTVLQYCNGRRHREAVHRTALRYLLLVDLSWECTTVERGRRSRRHSWHLSRQHRVDSYKITPTRSRLFPEGS